MEIIGVKTPKIKPEDDLAEIILNSLHDGKKLRNRDILVPASSVMSMSANRIRDIANVKPNEEAKKLTSRSSLNENFVEIIVQEADKILCPSKKCVLTMKDDMLRVNAGVDRSNVPQGKALLLPENPDKEAAKIREKLEEKQRKNSEW